LFLLFFFRFRCREIHSVDRTCRTYGHTLAAQTALRVVNVRDVVLNGNGTKRTLLLTLATTDAGCLTSLHGHRTLVLVDARDEHSPTLRALLAELDNVARTSLDAGATSHTLLFVNLGETCFRVDVDGVKLTGSHTITTP
jgi:hypothetical protein